MVLQSFVERILRPLVGIKCWDYIVLWKLSNDNRFIEWMQCCCAGSENIRNGGEYVTFESSSRVHCRDIMFPHPRTKPCDLLDQLPTSMIFDSGVHAQTLLLNQASWINYSHNSNSKLSEETIGTRVLVPVSLGLVELFVMKQVPEDHNVMDFIRSECHNIVLEQQKMMSHSATTHDSFSPDPRAQIASSSKENMDLPQDISADRINLCPYSPLLNPLQQYGNVTPETNDNSFTAYDSGIFTPSIEELGTRTQISNMRKNDSSRSSRWAANDESLVCENNMRSDDSDPNEDEDDAKYRRRTGKGPQSKNLMAERKRRKKLNDRLYSLRALVPNISKLDKSAIIGDAIDYVNELKRQVEDLQIELEEQSENEDVNEYTKNNVIHPSTMIHQNGTKQGHKRDKEILSNGYHSNTISKFSKQNQDNTTDKLQQMEPQVEVFQIDGNEFFVKVFCEYICGGFVQLMEAMNSLGLEVTNVNTTRHTCLVSSIFKVERKNDETVEAENVKESLLELTRNPSCPKVHLSHNTIDDTHHDYHIHQPYNRQRDFQH